MGAKLRVRNKVAVKLKVVDGEMNEEQLLELADKTYRAEAAAKDGYSFNCERDRSFYLRLSRQCNDTVHRDLKNLKTLMDTTQDLNLYKTIDKIYLYTLYCYDFAYNYVPGTIFRSEYMEQISSHSKSMLEEAVAAEAAKDSKAAMDKIANTAAWYRNTLQHYDETMKKPQDSFFINYMKLKESNVEDLVKRYMTKLNFRGQFNSLTIVQKLQVWNEIIKQSGKATFTITKDLNSLSDVGATVLLVTASLIVLDILISDHSSDDSLKDDMNAMSSQFSGIDKFSVDAMKIVCLDKMLKRYGHLPAGVVFGDDIVKGNSDMTGLEAAALAIGCPIGTAAVIVLCAIQHGAPAAVAVATVGEEIPMVSLSQDFYTALGAEEETAFLGEELAGEGIALIGEASEAVAIGEGIAAFAETAEVVAGVAAAFGPLGLVVVAAVGAVAVGIFVDYEIFTFFKHLF